MTEWLYGSFGDAVIGMRIVSAASNALELSRRVDALPGCLDLAAEIRDLLRGCCTAKAFVLSDLLLCKLPCRFCLLGLRLCCLQLACTRLCATLQLHQLQQSGVG